MTRFDPVKRLLLSLLMIGAIAAGPATRPTLPHGLQASDLTGQSRHLLDSNAKAVVLFFVGVECPVSNGYAPEISRLANAYGPEGAAFYVVYAGTDVSTAVAAKHAKDFKFTCLALIDQHCDLATAVGATMTLEAVVIQPDGSIVYRGRIDDQYVTLGKKRFAATKHDLQDALDAVLAGRPVVPRFTQAVGCNIVMPESGKP